MVSFYLISREKNRKTEKQKNRGKTLKLGDVRGYAEEGGYANAVENDRITVRVRMRE